MIRQNIIIYEEETTPHPSAKPTPSPQGEGKTRKKVYAMWREFLEKVTLWG